MVPASAHREPSEICILLLEAETLPRIPPNLEVAYILPIRPHNASEC